MIISSRVNVLHRAIHIGKESSWSGKKEKGIKEHGEERLVAQ
jgi:hypothetical protein